MTELDRLREHIDAVDEQICGLFEQRMALTKEVAAYKKEHNLSVFQGDREKAVLAHIDSICSEENRKGGRVLFQNLMDISKCLQAQSMPPKAPIISLLEQNLQSPPKLPENPRIACQGVAGAYSHIAAKKFFPHADSIDFYSTFEEVFEAVQNETADFGVLPVENSNAGSVMQVYQPMRHYSFYIQHRTKIRVAHCLCARPGVTKEQLTDIYSHPQAIMQCERYLSNLTGVEVHEHANTAIAAKMVAESDLPIAAICSELSAELYGLDILQRDIQDNNENFTRFVCISKQCYLQKDANRITISFNLPQKTKGALYRMLTKFSVHDVNMSKIESMPNGSSNFDCIFYVDLDGHVADQDIRYLLCDLEEELPDFLFLGNYCDTSVT